MTKNFLGYYSSTVLKDEIIAIHEAAEVIVNLACLCLMVDFRPLSPPSPQKSLCCIFIDISLFFFQTETNVVP